jgi:hypothetical protein
MKIQPEDILRKPGEGTRFAAEHGAEGPEFLHLGFKVSKHELY